MSEYIVIDKDYVSIGQASIIIGVSISTLRRWEDEGHFLPCYRTKGGHRRYKIQRIYSDILEECSSNNNINNNRKTYCYARVSSYDQKLDLLRQEKRLVKYCKEQKLEFEVISDLGSGLNYKKKALLKLITLLCQRKVGSLVLTHRDRLLRFGSPLLFKLCAFFGTKVLILEEQLKAKSFEQELESDKYSDKDKIKKIIKNKRHNNIKTKKTNSSFNPNFQRKAQA